MPFESKRQWRAAMGGHIPGISKEKAREWAHETDSFSDLPDRAPAEKGKRTLLTKKAAKIPRGTFHIMRRLEAQGFKDPTRGVREDFVREAVPELARQADEARKAFDLQSSPLTAKGHFANVQEEVSEFEERQEAERKREERRERRRMRKKAGGSLFSLCTKIAMPNPSLLTKAKPSLVGQFSGRATANSLKPPGGSALKTVINPRRNIRNAMTAFKA